MKQLIYPMKEQYEEFLIDESKFSGYADSISFPENEEEIMQVIREMNESGMPITIQGGKTGITGSCVPLGGHIMNLSRMNKVKESCLLPDGTGRITVEPGINLMDLKKEIGSRFRKTPLFWPSEPTESSATAGGIAALNAQGITRILYGTSRRYIESLKFIDSSARLHAVQKGQKLVLESGREIEMMDAVLGKEGITGAICELTLKLIPKPESIWGIAFFFKSTEDAGHFVDLLRRDLPGCDGAGIAAVEYLDRSTIRQIESHKTTMTKIRELPDVEEDSESMVYVEIHGLEEPIEVLAESLMETAMVCNSNPDEAWAVSGETEVEKLHAFRHGAAETVNLCIEEARRKEPRITKLGTDMAVTDMLFSDVLSCAYQDLEKEGLAGCVFGHALENHLHINILPKDYEEYVKGIGLIRKWAACVKEHQGKIAGEHGIGKLKKELLSGFISGQYMNLCSQLKETFDGGNLWNKGNIFPEQADSL